MLQTQKADWYIEKGEERTKVYLAGWRVGEDMLVCLYNGNAHLGSVAISQVDKDSDRIYTSMITLSGHKDDSVAQQAAYLISKHTRKPTCVIAGIHIDNITAEEIARVINNADSLIKEFLQLT